MKYRLKKDLPFAKAGAEVQVGLSISVRNRRHSPQWIGDPEDLELLIENGWIEEIKPREWTVVEYMGQIYNQTWVYSDGYKGERIIKVREVLE